MDECGWDVLSNKCAYVPTASPVLVKAPSSCARFTHLDKPAVLLPANPVPKDNITVVGMNLYPVQEYSIVHHYNCIFRDSATNASVAITEGEWASPSTLHCKQPGLAVTDPSGLGALLTVTVQLQGPGLAVELDDALLGTVQLYNCSSIRTAHSTVNVAVSARAAYTHSGLYRVSVWLTSSLVRVVPGRVGGGWPAGGPLQLLRY